MHQPRPYGLFVQGAALSEADVAATDALARSLTNYTAAAGLSGAKMVRDLPGGGTVIATNQGGTLRVIVSQPPAARPVEAPTQGLAQSTVPMLFSGVIRKAKLADGEGVSIRLTDMTRRRLIGYAKGKTLAPEDVELQRFRIPYGETFREFAPENSVLMHTQYAQQRPTWYSGAMAEVMQIVGGYGRQDFKALPESPIERASMKLPDGIRQRIAHELVNVRLPGYSGVPPKTGQFQYDYKANKTHAIGFDTERKPWLLRLSSAGLYAMPLPIIPATATKAFRAYIEDVGDDEIGAILDRFGGMPSGESFPQRSDEFEAWRRSGAIVKVCELAEFYAHLMYSTACGWSFNASGNEGFNTCYDYDGSGLAYGLAFKLKLALAPAKDSGRLPAGLHPDDPAEAARLNAYLSALYRKIADDCARNRAIKYKLRRVPVADLLELATPDADPDVDYWDALEVPPLAAHSGSMVEAGKGVLYHPNPTKTQPQIKFPEPFIGACLSFDFTPTQRVRFAGRCDTIMFGYYVGDSLKVVKYAYDGASVPPYAVDDFDECMIVGSWERTETLSESHLCGNFYTTDFDDREVAPAMKTVTRIVGRDLGFDSVPKFTFHGFYERGGHVFRHRYFSTETDAKTTKGYGKKVAICVPYLCRNAVLHATQKDTTGGQHRTSGSMDGIQDPNIGYFWTYDFVFHWRGWEPWMVSEPWPKDGAPVWLEKWEHDAADGCSAFADQGPFLGHEISWLVQPGKYSGGGGPPSYKGYSTSTNLDATTTKALKVSILDQTAAVHEDPDTMYFMPSPDEVLGYFSREACRNLFGAATYANVSEADGGDGRRKRWGFSALADHTTSHHFIGVINE